MRKTRHKISADIRIFLQCSDARTTGDSRRLCDWTTRPSSYRFISQRHQPLNPLMKFRRDDHEPLSAGAVRSGHAVGDRRTALLQLFNFHTATPTSWPSLIITASASASDCFLFVSLRERELLLFHGCFSFTVWSLQAQSCCKLIVECIIIQHKCNVYAF